jgi:hypothetical protein
MSDQTNNPICLVLASLIADDIAELMDATYDLDYALSRKEHYRKLNGGEFVPSHVKELSDRSCKRLNAVEKKLASIGINVQEAHNRLKAKQEAAA